MLCRDGTVNPWSPWRHPGLWCHFVLCCPFVITPFLPHSGHWALTWDVSCLVSGSVLTTDMPFLKQTNKKKKKWNIYAIISTGISSPQRHEHTGAKNWSRYFLSFFSQHSPLLCYGSSIFHMSKHHKEAFQLLPNPWNQLSMLHPIPTPSLVLPVVSSWLDDTCVLLNRL